MTGAIKLSFRSLLPPEVYFAPIEIDDLNRCLLAWGHKMGPLNRPMGLQIARLMVITAYFMAILDVAAVGFIVRYGWLVALTSGTGAAVGIVAAAWVHHRYVR